MGSVFSFENYKKFFSFRRFMRSIDVIAGALIVTVLSGCRATEFSREDQQPVKIALLSDSTREDVFCGYPSPGCAPAPHRQVL